MRKLACCVAMALALSVIAGSAQAVTPYPSSEEGDYGKVVVGPITMIFGKMEGPSSGCSDAVENFEMWLRCKSGNTIFGMPIKYPCQAIGGYCAFKCMTILPIAECSSGYRYVQIKDMSQLSKKSPEMLLSSVSQVDSDSDLIPNAVDNCKDVVNANQLDGDNDGHGDACDVCPEVADPDQADADGDKVGDICDCCVDFYNPKNASGVQMYCDECAFPTAETPSGPEMGAEAVPEKGGESGADKARRIEKKKVRIVPRGPTPDPIIKEQPVGR